MSRDHGEVTEIERREVLRAHMPNGRITELPIRRQDRLVVLDQIARALEPGVHYREEELNAVLCRFSADLVVLRRGLVDEGFLEQDRTSYWRCGGTVDL